MTVTLLWTVIMCRQVLRLYTVPDLGDQHHGEFYVTENKRRFNSRANKTLTFIKSL